MNQVEVEAIVAETQAFAEAMNTGDAALAASFYVFCMRAYLGPGSLKSGERYGC